MGKKYYMKGVVKAGWKMSDTAGWVAQGSTHGEHLQPRSSETCNFTDESDDKILYRFEHILNMFIVF